MAVNKICQSNRSISEDWLKLDRVYRENGRFPHRSAIMEIMETQINLSISANLYERVRQLAKIKQVDVSTVIVNVLEETIPSVNDDVASDEAINQEMAAYIALHPMLKQNYWGLHVAIQGGQLVDYDQDGVQLSKRIYEKYPNTFVWIAQVANDPIQTINIPSFRLIKEDA